MFGVPEVAAPAPAAVGIKQTATDEAVASKSGEAAVGNLPGIRCPAYLHLADAVLRVGTDVAATAVATVAATSTAVDRAADNTWVLAAETKIPVHGIELAGVRPHDGAALEVPDVVATAAASVGVGNLPAVSTCPPTRRRPAR